MPIYAGPMTGVIWAFKFCPQCETVKGVDEFSKNRAKWDGLCDACKLCRTARVCAWNKTHPGVLTERHRQWAKTNPEKARVIERRRVWKQRNVDITEEEYQIKYAESGGTCEICGRPEDTKSAVGATRALSLDHNHETGQARGLLCALCNVAFARVDIVPDWPERLVAYRNKWMEKTDAGLLL